MRHAEAEIAYRGIDISASMIAAARERWAGQHRAEFAVGSRCGRMADYSLASGIIQCSARPSPSPIGKAMSKRSSRICSACSRIGFAVNFMLPHDDKAAEEELYRSRPARWVAFCRQELGCSVRVLRGYGLREFTLLIRRKPRTAAPRQAGSRKAARRSPR